MVRSASILGTMVVAIVLLFWAGVHNLRTRRAILEANHVQLTPANGNPSAAPDEEGQGANLRGKTAPAFTLTGVDGERVSLSEYKGHPVMVNFWATWCGPCKLEMPWIEEFSNKYKPQGLVVLGLSQDEGASRADVAAAAKRLGVHYPILMPDDTTAKAYGGVDYLPETFFVDKAGKVVQVTSGVPSKDQMEAEIQQTIAAGGL